MWTTVLYQPLSNLQERWFCDHQTYNVVRDPIAEILQEVCKDVRIEPQLLPVTGEELPARANIADGARADVSAIGLWQPLNRAFLDIKVFNPLASSNVT